MAALCNMSKAGRWPVAVKLKFINQIKKVCASGFFIFLGKP